MNKIGFKNLNDLEREIKTHHFPQIADATELKATEQFLLFGYENHVSLDRLRRGSILEKVLFFYKIHIEGFGEVRSLDVLKEVLR